MTEAAGWFVAAVFAGIIVLQAMALWRLWLLDRRAERINGEDSVDGER